MTKIIKFLFIIIIFSPWGIVYSKSPPPGTGTSDIPANILIMLDKSGSMDWNISGRTTLEDPTDVEVDSSGNIYILEYGRNRITKWNSSGTYIKDIGQTQSCNRWRGSWFFKISDDKIYIADYDRRELLKLDLNGNCIKRVRTPYHGPNGIEVANGYVFVTHYYAHRIAVYNTSNLGFVTSKYTGSTDIYYPQGIDVNAAGNKLVLANDYSHKVTVWNVSGPNIGSKITTIGSSASSANGRFYRPYGANFDSNGNIFISEVGNDRVQKFNSSYVYQAKAGSWGGANGFKYALGMTLDSSDNVYISDYQSLKVRKYDNSLNYDTDIGGTRSRMDSAKRVIKKIVSNTELTSGANFGLMEWSYSWKTKIPIEISPTGAQRIFNYVDSIKPYGGTDLRSAMNKARDHFTSNQVSNWNLSCSQNYLIVISDGDWSYYGSPNSIASHIKNAYNIKTFAVGFAGYTSFKTNYSSLATAGGTTDPLYADNEVELLAKLTDAIKQSISGTLTFTTPVVVQEASKNEYIYQSTFKYEKNKQWEGHLKKYKINNDGLLGDQVWDAAETLNDKNATSRKIWTAGLSSSSTNNFTTTYRDELKRLLFPNASPTDDEVDDLINFVRGVDTYDEDGDNNTTESRHKLSDIYHSELSVVGPVEGSIEPGIAKNSQKTDAYYRSVNNYKNFKEGNSCGVVGGSCKTRKEVILAGSNGGILHAFDSSDINKGDELWGYIPPNLLGKLSTMISSKTDATNPIYGVDGSPIVKDIYYDDTPDNSRDDPVWKTIVLTGLGAGGYGYFALDITDINSPKHLFAIENDPFRKVIKHWDSDEIYREYNYKAGIIDPELDYRKLGETWSTPRIIRIKVSGKDKWVAVFGGGNNNKVNSNYGSAVFVMDLENEGKLLKKIDIEDVEDNPLTKTYTGDGSKTKFNIPFSFNNTYHTLRVTVNEMDTEGFSITGSTVTFNDAPLNGDKILIKRLKVENIVNAIPSDLTVITANGSEKANYSGAIVYAADLEGKITKINLTDQGTLYDTTTLFNAESDTSNGRFIYKKAEATINNDNNLWLYFGTGDTQRLQNQSSKILNRVYGIKDKDFPNFKIISSTGTVSQCKKPPSCPTTTDLGWYVDLKKAQKVTAEPTINKDLVYFPTYEPTTATNACKTGKAILGQYDTKCGTSTIFTLGTGVLSKVVVQGDKLYIGISGEAEDKGKFTSKDNLITAESDAEGDGAIKLEGWKENY